MCTPNLLQVFPAFSRDQVKRKALTIQFSMTSHQNNLFLNATDHGRQTGQNSSKTNNITIKYGLCYSEKGEQLTITLNILNSIPVKYLIFIVFVLDSLEKHFVSETVNSTVLLCGVQRLDSRRSSLFERTFSHVLTTCFRSSSSGSLGTSVAFRSSVCHSKISLRLGTRKEI